jgi:glucose-6-phosphate 1-dehydrogenase
MANDNLPDEHRTLTRIHTSDSALDPDACRYNRQPDPVSIVIFGATGDLSARKLIPALFNLYCNDGLPARFSIVGCGRTGIDAQEFVHRLEKKVAFGGQQQRSQWQSFAKSIHYHPLVYDETASYERFAIRLKTLDSNEQTRGNRMFYLALPPWLHQEVAHRLGRSGLSQETQNGSGWARLVVEKPFGHDLDSAVELDRGIHEHFREHQVFRIDHYLAKETVQNILMFRFANSIFEPIWNRRYIDSIDINATETLGVEHRAGYYEQAGVLRDMFQNHMMQLLALTAMEPPSIFEADRVRDERVKVFRALRPFPVQRLRDDLILGQYGRGVVDGKQVNGYREESGVDPQSLTPTYARMKVYVDNWRWQGVPFFLTSGKRLAKKSTEIIIRFKDVPHSMFRSVLGETITGNRLHLGIHPDEKITMTFQTKQPGAKVCLRSVTMDFNYYQGFGGPVLDAYEKVLLDCMMGDQMNFWRQDAVEQCWTFLTPILTHCETCGDRSDRLHIYAAGSNGPDTAMRSAVN